MSHQDGEYGTTNAQDLQSVLDWLVPRGVLAGLKFRQEGFWSPRSLVFAALMWSWSGKPNLTRRFAEARKIVAHNAPPDQQPGQSYSGFIKRLQCWSERLIGRLVDEFRRSMREDLSEYFLVAGWLLLAGDGSRIATPRTRSNEKQFAAKRKRKPAKKKKKGATRRQQLRKSKRKQQAQADRDKKAGTPQIWLTVLYHVTLGLPWAWRSGPSDSSERDHLIEMAQELPDNALVAMDAGFVGYDFWEELNQAGTAFVARIGANVKLLKNLGYIRRQRDIVYLWPDKARRKLQPPLVLRLECFRGGKEQVYLVTNVLEEHRLSTSQLIEIYAARWGIELYYRDLKQTFERSKLRSKKAANAQLELDWSIVGLWAMGLYAAAEQMANGIAPRRRSVAGVLNAFRLPMEQYKSVPDEGEDICSLLTTALKDDYHRRSSKASRGSPRKKKKRAIGAPSIIPATQAQQTAAKAIKTILDTAA